MTTRPEAVAGPRPRQDPRPEGPEGEPVGEDENTPTSEEGEATVPVPGPGLDDHEGPDANPIDPRVF